MPTDLMYRHQPLQSEDDFRLMRINPGRFEWETVHCEILHYRRTAKNLPPFDALSYVWGDPSRPATIHVGSRQLYVTQNCFAAIRRLRRENEPRLVWIDAICLNQEDDQEKTVQVRRMGEIYRLAETVIAFLGEEDDVSKVVWDFAEATDQEYLWSPDLEVSEVVEAAVRSVLKRVWFSRIWVLQEVYQGQSGDFPRTLVMCSDRLLDWCDFACICESFEYWYRPFVITMGRRLQTSLFETLCRTRVSKATDPRDKLFAIIPLLTDDEDLAVALTLSYSQTTEWIYTQIGLYLLRRYQLNVLSPVRYPHLRYPKLASWIPDWSQAHDTYLYKGQLVERREPECPFYSVTFQPYSGNSSNRSHEFHPVLTVNGVQLGRIISTGKVLNLETSPHACMQFIQDFTRGRKACQSSVYMPTTFVQSTTVTQNFGNIFPTDSTADNLELWTHYVQRCRLFHDTFDQIGLAPAEAMAGDVVCAISEAFNICIFRPRPCGGYTLISGDCVTTRANEDHLELLRDGLLQNFIAKLGAEHLVVESFELY